MAILRRGPSRPDTLQPDRPPHEAPQQDPACRNTEQARAPVERADADPLTPATASWCSVAEAARVLGVSATTVRRRITDGRLTARREPYRQSFRWLVLLPTDATSEATPGREPAGSEAVATHGTVPARLAALRDADEELRAIAARVDLTRDAVTSVLERERAVALRQATFLERLAETPATHLGGTESDVEPRIGAEDRAAGSLRALLVGLFVCLTAAIAGAFVALPAWTDGIVGAIAVVSGLIAAVEAYLVGTAWASGLGRRRST